MGKFDVHQNLRQAVALHQAGKIETARAIYDKILEAEPDHAEALHLSGVAAYQSGHVDAAMALIGKAIELGGSFAVYHNNLGNACLQAGRAGGAVTHYRRAIDLQPDYAEAHFGLGNACFGAGDRQQAIAAYTDAVKWSPRMAEAHNNLGIVLGEIGRTDQALAAFRRAIAIDPGYIDARFNLAHALKRAGVHAEAVIEYNNLLRLDPDSSEIHAALGEARHALGQLHEALACYQRALQAKPDCAATLNDLGTVYMDLNQPRAARRCFEQCLSLKPDDAGACNNLGVLSKSIERYDEAIAWYRKAIGLRPDFAEAYCNLGNVFARQKQIRQAISCYRRSIAIRPDYTHAHSCLVRQLQHGCMWEELVPAVTRLRALTDGQIAGGVNSGLMPFLAFSICDDPHYNLAVAKSWCRRAFGSIAPIGTIDYRRREGPSNQRICIGYLSGDFKNHATAHLMAGLFRLHDRSRFRIHAYSYGIEDHSEYRVQIAADCDRFFDLRPLSHREAALKIKADGVDILVDLKGHTEGNRLEICAYRPAPIQVAYLGFPGSYGADCIDYLIGDAVVTPPSESACFSEKLILMPHSYQVNDRYQEIFPTPMSRRAAGLPDEAFVFCSFNEPYKIEPVLFDVWMSILRQVSDSVLWLLETSAVTVNQLKRQAEVRGVAPQRLIFGPKLAKKQHLARLQLADLGLDTRLVNGHTTTSDALWAGVPVVTICGMHFASRVSTSLLRAIGLSELVADSLTAYEAKAIEFAINTEKLQRVKVLLKHNRSCSPLFDTDRFTRNLERAYMSMWIRHLSVKPPRMLNIQDAQASI